MLVWYLYVFLMGLLWKLENVVLGGSSSGFCFDLGTIFTISRCIARILGTKDCDLPLIWWGHGDI